MEKEGLDNESKQNNKLNKRKLDEPGTSKDNKKKKIKDYRGKSIESKGSNSKVKARVPMEDQDIIKMEVEGQCTKFYSEDEADNTELNESSCSENTTEKEEEQASLNNNATTSSRLPPAESCETRKAEREIPQVQSVQGVQGCESNLDYARVLDEMRKEQQKKQEQEEEEAFFDRFSEYMAKKGLLSKNKDEDTSKKNADRRKKHSEHALEKRSNISSAGNIDNAESAPSEATIYQPAVKRASSLDDLSSLIIENMERWHSRISGSSDENDNDNSQIITSDESTDEINLGILDIADRHDNERYRADRAEPRPHGSKDQEPPLHDYRRSDTAAADERRERICREAENSKARVFEISGKKMVREIENSRIQAVLIDEEYLAIGAHLDETLKKRIEMGGYVDLAKLLPRDKISSEEDHRLEVIQKGGMTYWVPAAERELTPVNSYIHWEQAFHVYINIFAKNNPDRVTELLQYNHVIEVAAVSYPWENVYKYD